MTDQAGITKMESTTPAAESHEKGPQGRYVKLGDRLGSGSYKDVWRAYDSNEGREVAWNVVKLNRIPPSERKRIKTEVKLLRDIQHKNVIKYYNSWVDREKEQIIFITEIMSHGSLNDYIRNHPMIRWNAVKRWCRQILEGLEFLHGKQIIHRDIKGDNIFINGSTGDLRIGDLGLSTRISEERAMQQSQTGSEASAEVRPITAAAMTCLGTPEFMAPELYMENYNEKVDIYAFGMTVLEIVTGRMPYHDCTSTAQIYRKVLAGELPPELEEVKEVNKNAFALIQSCLMPVESRPSASALLEHEFLVPNEQQDYEEVRVKLWQRGKPDTIKECVEEEEEEEEEEEGGGDDMNISELVKEGPSTRASPSASIVTEGPANAQATVIERKTPCEGATEPTSAQAPRHAHEYTNGHGDSIRAEVLSASQQERIFAITQEGRAMAGSIQKSGVGVPAKGQIVESKSEPTDLRIEDRDNGPVLIDHSDEKRKEGPENTRCISADAVPFGNAQESLRRTQDASAPKTSTVSTDSVEVFVGAESNQEALSSPPVSIVASDGTGEVRESRGSGVRVRLLHTSHGPSVDETSSAGQKAEAAGPAAAMAKGKCAEAILEVNPRHSKPEHALRAAAQTLSKSSKTGITISDLTDSPLNSHTVVVHLRVPTKRGVSSVTAGMNAGKGFGDEAEGEGEFDIEFEFDLLVDDTQAIAVEMQECEDLRVASISSLEIIAAVNPLVDIANKVLMMRNEKVKNDAQQSDCSNGNSSFGSLSRAVLIFISKQPDDVLDPALYALRRIARQSSTPHTPEKRKVPGNAGHTGKEASDASMLEGEGKGKPSLALNETTEAYTRLATAASTHSTISSNIKIHDDARTYSNRSTNTASTSANLGVGSDPLARDNQHAKSGEQGSSSTVMDNLLPDSDVDSEDSEDAEYAEMMSKYTESKAKTEKDYSNRASAIATQRSKTEESFRKESDSLAFRQDDLDKQLASMMNKFQERMDVFRVRRQALLAGETESGDNGTAGLAIAMPDEAEANKNISNYKGSFEKQTPAPSEPRRPIDDSGMGVTVSQEELFADEECSRFAAGLASHRQNPAPSCADHSAAAVPSVACARSSIA